MADFIKFYELWTADGALEMKVLEASDERFDFDITRCRYAETYKEMGLGKIGHLLSCNRDGTFCEGYDPNISLERKQTIMQGAPARSRARSASSTAAWSTRRARPRRSSALRPKSARAPSSSASSRREGYSGRGALVELIAFHARDGHVRVVPLCQKPK